MLVDSNSTISIRHQMSVDVAMELYAGIISKTKSLIDESFGQKPPATYHDGEKRLILDLARDVFRVSVTPETLQAIVDDIGMPEIESIGLGLSEPEQHEPAAGKKAVTPGKEILGF